MHNKKIFMKFSWIWKDFIKYMQFMLRLDFHVLNKSLVSLLGIFVAILRRIKTRLVLYVVGHIIILIKLVKI